MKWKVLPGSRMTFGTILLIYECLDSDNISSGQPLKLKSQTEGTVQTLIAREGDIITPGCGLLELQSCLHSVVMKDLCAECGADLRELGGDRLAQVVADTSVSMIHSVPELRVSQAQAQKLGEADEQRLLKSRKLVLLVDLDQTLIHTTNENVPPDMKGVFHFQLYGARSPWYHTKFRPGTNAFLEKVSSLYELHIFTFGARPYAHHIASLLDPNGCFFSHRILSRDECLNASSKSGNLKALFPCGDSMVCIIDDREDVWNFAPNVVQVKAYHFFTGTGDINSPPNLPTAEVPSQTEKTPQAKSNDSVSDVSNCADEQKAEEKGNTGEEPAEPKMETDVPDIRDRQDEGSDDKSSNGSDGYSSNASKTGVEKLEIKDDAKTGFEKLESQNESKTAVEELESRNDGNCSNDSNSKDEKPGTKNGNNSSVGDKPEDEKLTISKSNSSCDSNSSDEKLQICAGDSNSSDSKSSILKPENGQSDCTETKSVVDKENGDKEEGFDKIVDIDSKASEGKLDETISSTSSSQLESSTKLHVLEDDDYLLYLEEILTTIHQAFYDMHDQLLVQGERIPDLKSVIPYVRRKVLKGLNIVFSGVIPTTVNPEKSKMWSLAKAFGANVNLDVVGSEHPLGATTHVIAARMGTAKVNKAKKMKGVHIINPDWLTCCTERWEKVDERLFPLTEEAVLRKPFRHHDHRDKLSMDFPPNVTYTGNAMQAIEPLSEPCPVYDPVTGKRIRLATLQGSVSVPVVHVKNMRRSKKGNSQQKINAPDKFSDSLSPLLSFSSNEIEAMGREVDDACSEDSENGEDSRDSEGYSNVKKNKESSSEESLDGGEKPRGWKKRKKGQEGAVEEVGGMLESEDEMCASEYRRELIPVDSDRSIDSDSDDMNQSIGSVDEEMAAAVEREFLGS